jgi:hypothetical protein
VDLACLIETHPVAVEVKAASGKLFAGQAVEIELTACGGGKDLIESGLDKA